MTDFINIILIKYRAIMRPPVLWPESHRGNRRPCWLVALLALFTFELVEGVTHYRVYARQLMEESQIALTVGNITPEMQRLRDDRLSNFLLYLDIPMFISIMALGFFKPF